VSLICGSRAERGKARPDTACPEGRREEDPQASETQGARVPTRNQSRPLLICGVSVLASGL
jgi:hypothetical protein